jgi:hypothetical protein
MRVIGRSGAPQAVQVAAPACAPPRLPQLVQISGGPATGVLSLTVALSVHSSKGRRP